MSARKELPKLFDDLILITKKEAAERYQCSVRTIERAVQKEEIDGYKPGSKLLIDQATGDSWFMSTKVVQPARKGRPRLR